MLAVVIYRYNNHTKGNFTKKARYIIPVVLILFFALLKIDGRECDMMKRLLDDVFVAEGSTNVGVIFSGAEFYLVDTPPLCKDADILLQEIASTAGGDMRLKAILLTHSHADHAGSAAHLQELCDCQVYATKGESGSLVNPFLQGTVVWGGNPIKELRSDYFCCKSVEPTHVITAGSTVIKTEHGEISFVLLTGHYFEMVGVVYKQNGEEAKSAIFCADAFFGRHHIARYSIPFLFDSGSFVRTLDTLCATHYDYYVPSHGSILTSAAEIIEMNKVAIMTVEEAIIRSLCDGALSTEEILCKVASQFSLELKITQYALILSTVRGFLKSLVDAKKVGYRMDNNRLVYFLV